MPSLHGFLLRTLFFSFSHLTFPVLLLFFLSPSVGSFETANWHFQQAAPALTGELIDSFTCSVTAFVSMAVIINIIRFTFSGMLQEHTVQYINYTQRGKQIRLTRQVTLAPPPTPSAPMSIYRYCARPDALWINHCRCCSFKQAKSTSKTQTPNNEKSTLVMEVQ